MSYQDHIVRDPEVCGGQPVIKVQVKWGLRGRPLFTAYPFSRHVAKVLLLHVATLHL